MKNWIATEKNTQDNDKASKEMKKGSNTETNEDKKIRKGSIEDSSIEEETTDIARVTRMNKKGEILKDIGRMNSRI